MQRKKYWIAFIVFRTSCFFPGDPVFKWIYNMLFLGASSALSSLFAGDKGVKL